MNLSKVPEGEDKFKSGQSYSRLENNRVSPNQFASPRNARAINSAMAEHSVFAGKYVNKTQNS